LCTEELTIGCVLRDRWVTQHGRRMMRSFATSCAAVVLLTLVIPGVGQAGPSSLNVSMTGLGAPFDPPGSAFDYWSGAYAEAGDDLAYVEDDRFPPTLPNVGAVTANAASGGGFAEAGTLNGLAWFEGEATLTAGRSYAYGYGMVEHWIDFEASSPVTVGARLDISIGLDTTDPLDIAYYDLYAWAALYQRAEDGSGDWNELDEVEFSDGLFVAGGVDFFDSDSYDHWFDPIGPGTYSLGFGGEMEVGVERDEVPAVPAPGALLLAGLGTGLVGMARRRKNRRDQG
jgi:hypothetical protein